MCRSLTNITELLKKSFAYKTPIAAHQTHHGCEWMPLPLSLIPERFISSLAWYLLLRCTIKMVTLQTAI